MIRHGDSTERRVKHLEGNIAVKENIINFIENKVDSWCKDNKDKEFAARDLFGSANCNWSDTPLIELYEYHKSKGSSNPEKLAGIDLGWLLKSVIIKNSKTFDTSKKFVRQYKCIS
jgi:hypothetical protein